MEAAQVHDRAKSSMTPILETQKLSRRFGALQAVKDLNLSVDAGEVFGLLGPNGAGKTTVIKMLTTLLPPSRHGPDRGLRHPASAGSRPARHRLRAAAAVRRRHADRLREPADLRQALRHAARRAQRRACRTRWTSWAWRTSADKLVRTYSGGMIRRLEIAQSMLHRPPVLFLDEPTVGLDPLARQAVWEHHRAAARADYGMTIFLTTHYMEEADSLCTRVAIMHHGQVAAIGTPGRAEGLHRRQRRHAGRRLRPLHRATSWNSGGSYRETSRTRRTARRLG